MAPPQISRLLDELVAQTPGGPVDLEWFLARLDKRSFGLLLLLLGLLVIIPGISTIATLALLFPAVEMILNRSAPWFPRLISKRSFDSRHLTAIAARVRPLLQAIERVCQPRWNARHDLVGRPVGLIVFLLALTAGWPLPLVNVVPGIVVVVIAIAYMQEDGLLLVIGCAAAVLWLSGFGWTAWASATAFLRWLAGF